MPYHATITTDASDAQRLAELLRIEAEESGRDRASYTVRRDGTRVLVEVEADDSVALRAMLVGITKVLTVHEKVGAMPLARADMAHADTIAAGTGTMADDREAKHGRE